MTRPHGLPSHPPRAIIYLRQSVYREDSVSLEIQESINRDYCNRRGYQVVAVESDPGVSGRRIDRPGFRRVTSRLDQGDAEVVVAWKWSRYFRHRLHFNVALHEIESRGAQLESATEPVDATTASGRLQRGMLAELAAFESERTGEVWKETHDRRRRAGLPAQGGGRFGYTREGNTFTPHPEQAPVLRWMYEAYIGGAGFASITRDLNRRSIRNRLDRIWQMTTVRQILDSGFAAGLIVHNKRRRLGADFYPGQHPPLIDKQTWEAYRATRQRRGGQPGRDIEPKYPLTGLILCGDCDAPMHATQGGQQKTGHSYLCSRWQRTGQGRCVTIVRHRAEAAVLAWLAELRDDVSAAADADSLQARRQLRAQATASQAGSRVAAIERKLAELTRRHLDGTYPDLAYRITRDDLVEEHAAMQRLADEARAETVTTRAAAVQPTAAFLVAEWDTLPVRTRRNLLNELIRAVRIYPSDRRGGRARVEIQPVWHS